jgi:hypothetical protein
MISRDNVGRIYALGEVAMSYFRQVDRETAYWPGRSAYYALADGQHVLPRQKKVTANERNQIQTD